MVVVGEHRQRQPSILKEYMIPLCGSGGTHVMRVVEINKFVIYSSLHPRIYKLICDARVQSNWVFLGRALGTAARPTREWPIALSKTVTGSEVMIECLV